MTEFILCPYNLKLEKPFLEIIIKGELVATIYDDANNGIKIVSKSIGKIEIENDSDTKESVISIKLKSKCNFIISGTIYLWCSFILF